MIQIQNSFFPEDKGNFDANVFVNEQISQPFTDWISSSILSAFSDVKQMSEIHPLTTRVKSDVFHDVAFSQIMKNASILPSSMEPKFFSDFSGNKKQYFELNGYYYVIRKSGVILNGTKVDHAITNQELSKHVITIEYAIDEFWNNVTSISFKYVKGDGIELDYILQPDSNNVLKESINGTSDDTSNTYTPHFKDNSKSEII